MIYKDIKLIDPTGDLLFKNGDLSIGASDDQHIFDIINDNRGEWVETPNVGVGINYYINGSDLYNLNKNIQIQLQNDGYEVNSIDLDIDSESKLTITPNAVRK